MRVIYLVALYAWSCFCIIGVGNMAVARDRAGFIVFALCALLSLAVAALERIADRLDGGE